ncbi:MAG: hypothetical protein SOV74_09555 [Coriobacteriales bacterium]|nr:hypothetical protein [Coriobacteriales bacterium]
MTDVQDNGETGTVWAGNIQHVHRVKDGFNGFLVELKFPGVERSTFDFYETIEQAEGCIEKWNGKEMEPLTEEEFKFFRIFELYNSPEVESGWI